MAEQQGRPSMRAAGRTCLRLLHGFFIERHEGLVERHEGLGAEPVSFIGDICFRQFRLGDFALPLVVTP
jgi:hypothetical protein